MRSTYARMAVLRPEPVGSEMKMLNPGSLMSRPSSRALMARSWPMVPSSGDNSSVVSNLRVDGSQNAPRFAEGTLKPSVVIGRSWFTWGVVRAVYSLAFLPHAAF